MNLPATKRILLTNMPHVLAFSGSGDCMIPAVNIGIETNKASPKSLNRFGVGLCQFFNDRLILYRSPVLRLESIFSLFHQT